MNYGGKRWKRRSRSRRSQVGREAAERHIREAAEFSREIGGLDADVKRFFFSLRDVDLEAVLVAYGLEHGAAKEAYARKALPEWRQGNRKMSGSVAKRLFGFLPPRMPYTKKLELAENVWRVFGPESSHSYFLGPEASINEVTDCVAAKLHRVVTGYRVPREVRKRFEWLSAGDVQAQEELLNHCREKEKALAMEKVRVELPILQEQVRNHSDFTHRAMAELKVQRHSVELWVDGRLDNEVREGRPSPVRSQGRRSNRWIGWLMIWMALLLGLLSMLS